MARKAGNYFFRTAAYQDACIRRIEVVGEAAGRSSKDLCERYPEIPWRDAIDMRNKLIHGYGRINLNTVWNVVARELPPLVAQLERILEDHATI